MTQGKKGNRGGKGEIFARKKEMEMRMLKKLL